MEWINVNKKHFVDLELYKDGSYKWGGQVGTPFMVAVPLSSGGWCIQQVVLTDGIGLECHTDDDGNTYFGWDITDVTHWMEIEPPEATTNLISNAGNTIQKCDLLPSELLNRYNESVEALVDSNTELEELKCGLIMQNEKANALAIEEIETICTKNMELIKKHSK